MHMADALLSPAVGGTLWAASAGALAFCTRNVQRVPDDRKIPLMGVLGAFIFAAQMINFTIPATGSSGHLGGGLLLAILLGPHAAVLVIASVLTVQALLFADGGLLALGCNLFNLGVIPCCLAYPLLYKPLAGNGNSPLRVSIGATVAAIAGLQLGALGVVFETVFSGIAELPFQPFLWAMLPVHLAIGLVEGLASSAVLSFVRKARPELLACATARPLPTRSRTKVLTGLALAAALTGGVVSWFASPLPDGLEWAIARTAGTKQLAPPQTGIHPVLAATQQKTALLPAYAFRHTERDSAAPAPPPPAWPAVEAGTSVSGLAGGGLTLLLAMGIGLVFRKRNRVA